VSRGQSRVLDGLIVAAVFWVGAFAGARYLSDRRMNALGDFVVYAAKVACGGALSAHGDFSPAFMAFVGRERESVSCADVLADRQPKAAGPFVESQRNLIYVVAAAIRVGGLSWTTLDRFMGGLFGLSMALVYGLLRLTLWRGLAIIGAAAVLCSDHIAQLANLRDFSKEASFVAAWLTIGWLLLRRGERASSALYLPACVAGIVVGFGIGFRLDLMACVPVFPAVIALAVAGWDRRAVVDKGVAIAGFFLAFGTTAAPTLMALSTGSNSAHVAILGLGRSFTTELGLESPVYDVGDTYSDGFVQSLIAAHALVVQHDPVEARLGTADYDRQGFRFLADNAENFPADQVIRAIAANVQVIRYPFAERSRRAHLVEPLFPPGILLTLTRWRAWLFSWVDGYAPLVAVFALCVICARDWRTGAAVTLLIAYFCGYSMIQFSRRHTFHFDVIPVNLLLIAVQAACVAAAAAAVRGRAPRRERFALGAESRRAVVALGVLGLAAVPIACVLLAARGWQQRHVSAALDRTLKLEWEPVESPQEPFSLVRDGVVEPTWAGLYQSADGPWRQPLVLVHVPSFDLATVPDPRSDIRWEYLRLDVGGSGCAARVVPVALKYTGSVPTLHWEYTRAFELPVDADSRRTVLLVPILYRAGSSRFDGFVVRREQAPCIAAVHRADPRATVPLPMIAAVLPPNWRTLPLYQYRARKAG
jgi:hypothetical protein